MFFKRKRMSVVFMACLILGCQMSLAADISGEEAVAIAEKVWKERFTQGDGYPSTDIYKPYIPVSIDGYWCVTGTRPKSMIGGVPVVEIRKSDGYILNVYHTK